MEASVLDPVLREENLTMTVSTAWVDMVVAEGSSYYQKSKIIRRDRCSQEATGGLPMN